MPLASRHPEIGPEHRAYYLDRSTDCYVATDTRPALAIGQLAGSTAEVPV